MTDQAERERPPTAKAKKPKKANGAGPKTDAQEPVPTKATKVAPRTRAESPQPVARVETWWEVLKDSYFNIDRRTLGFTRICLGWFLIGDLLRRTPDWIHMFGDTGVLPTTLILSRPQAANFS